MIHKFTALVAVVVLMNSVALRADDQAAAANTEARLRDALKNAMLQLRDAQNQLVTVQVAQAQSDKDNADLKTKADALTGQVTTLTKQSADDKDASDKTIATLNSQVSDLTGQVTHLNADLKQWKDAYNQVAQLAALKEAARAQLAAQAAILQRTVDDRETKNLELFKTGNEILTRYEKFSLGDALSAKEPFVGLTRVKLEELVQDYQGKLLDGRFAPGPPSAPPASGQTSSPSKQASAPQAKVPSKT